MAAKRRAPHPWERVAKLAGRQHGVVNRTQLLACGLSGQTIETATHQGRLHRVYRAVYAVGYRRLSARGRWMAAVLACGEGAVLSHLSAAALWRIHPTAGDDAEVTVPRSYGRRPHAGIRVHVSRSLPRGETRRRDGIPVTSPARTVMDIAAVLPRRDLERALDEADRLRLTSRTEPTAIARAHPGHRGAARLLSVLADHDIGSTLTRRGLEELFLALCREHGLPQPEVNTRVHRYEVDFLWRAEGLIIETDGWESHRTRAAFERDRERDARLTLLGWVVLRFSYRRVVRERKVVASMVRSGLRQALRSPSPL